MKKGLYPILATILISLLILSFIFERQLNALSSWAGVIIIILVGVVCFGIIHLALWDTDMLPKKHGAAKPNEK